MGIRSFKSLLETFLEPTVDRKTETFVHLKIAQVTPYFYPPSLGGVELTVHYLSRALAARQHDVHIFTADKDLSGHRIVAVASSDTRYGIKIHRVPTIRLFYRYEYPLKAGLINLQDFDVIHVHSPHHIFTNCLARQMKVKNATVVLTCFAWGQILSGKNILRSLVLTPIEIMARGLVHRANVIHVKNIGDYERISRTFRDKKVVIVPDGLPDYYFSCPNREVYFRNKYGLTDHKLILYVGRFHHLKGPQVILRSLHYIVKQDPEVLAVFIGSSGHYLRSLEKMSKAHNLEKHVKFFSNISEYDKIGAYDSAELVIIPSLSDFVEAYSLVLSEAWARQKPVIASKVGALKTRIKDGRNGILIEPGNPEALARCVLNLLHDDILKRKIIAADDKDIFSWNDVAATMERIYRSS